MADIKWTPLINDNIPLAVLTKTAPTKGNIVYEYNPFHNYRILQNMYEYKDGLYSLADLWNNFKIVLKCKIEVYDNKDFNGNQVEYDNSNIKYYKIITEQIPDLTQPSEDPSLPEEPSVPELPSIQLTTEDYERTAKIIVAAFKEGRNSDRINLEKALKEASEKGDKFTESKPNDNEKLTLAIDWYSFLDNLTENTTPILREAGELTDFITDELSFDLEHPVHMLPLYSYDGSVNLILNDGKNTPKLINSRFSATGKNTYEVCDRKGNNDTNIYDLGELFTIDTSLYKLTESIAQVRFDGISYGGALKVGNYHFYFKVADADGNESDFIAESGLVSVFLGSDSYLSVSTGERDLDSHKQVQFLLSNLDSAYNYVHVYYSRYTAENNLNRIIEYKKIDKNYLINNVQVANIIISGFEQTIPVTAEDINLQFNVVDSAYTSAICQNRLFMANVHKPDIPYNELLDLSLRILPYLNTELYEGNVNENYSFQSSSRGYIDPKYIYEKTGYWTGELYRFGIVYIMKDNTLSPVFNIRGGCNVGRRSDESDDKVFYTNIDVYDEEGKRKYITSDEESFKLIKEQSEERIASCLYENVKGVVSFECDEDTNIVYSVNMVIPYEVKLELSKHVKGYFFVRLPRIPFKLALGITIGINKESGTPTIPTKDGIVKDIASLDLSKTHVCVGEDNNGHSSIDGVVYASEGFLSRYKFKLVLKKSSLFKDILKWTGMAIAIAASVVVTVASFGVGSIGTLAIIAGAIALAPSVVLAVAGGIDTLIKSRWGRTRTYNRWNTEIPSNMKAEELDDSRKLVHDFDKRVILTASDENYVAGILCPDYELDQPHFNSVFIADEHLIEYTRSLSINLLNQQGDNYFNNDGRHFYMPSYTDINVGNYSISAKIIGLTDNLKVGVIEDLKFRARAGEAEEAFRIESVGSSFRSSESLSTKVDDEKTIDNRKINSDIIRGSFGPFLGFYDKASQLQAGTTVNIYTAGYDASKMENYVYQRACDNQTFYTISDRFILNTNSQVSILGVEDTSDTEHDVYRGDCYICQFTHRVNRNFLDPAALFNDLIIEEDTWKKNYDPGNQENLDLINLGDVNAIQLGIWVTFKVRSSNNLNIRTEDTSYVEEHAMTNHPRSYYPKTPMSVEGTYKIPESQAFNAGFKKLLSERYNFEVPDVPWIKNWYGTRIMYSNINVSDSFLNGFRVFKGLNYRDYTREYGSITKLISLESSLLCVFEHGVALIPVNERAVAGLGAGGFAYINTSNVLPENPKILSDVYGSQWADSILKVPGKFGDNTQYVYGVDTVAKKIWRTDGNTLTCISDRKVQEFLNNNITLSESELTPKLGIRNVKTFYNAFKRDVLFTFYDNTYGFEEKVWNLCWNELMQQFVTFYSWVPSVMENINNIPFSFNRNTTKWIAKLGTSHTNSSFADGITLNNVVINNQKNNDNAYCDSDKYNFTYTYKTVDGEDAEINLTVEDKENFIGVLSLSNRILPELNEVPNINYSLERDPWHNYEIFDVRPISVENSDGFNIITEGKLTLPKVDIKVDNKILKQSKYSGTIQFWGLFFNVKNEIEAPILSDEPIILTDYYDPYDIMSELYYRNKAGIVRADKESSHKHYTVNKNNYREYFNDCVENQYPIFVSSTGKRENLKEPFNMDKIVRLLNIKATIEYTFDNGKGLPLSDDYYNIAAGYKSGTNLIDAGYYQSTVAVIPKWNLSLLSTDFWKHGLAGIFDIADDIYPTYWYGEQHPFEFEFIVANEPGKHKIFDNLQIISNKAEPESFHYEIVGECYEFAKDKKNMYIRQEATKELYQYNGSDITFNHDYNKLVEKRRDVETSLEIEDLTSYNKQYYDKSTIFPLYYGRLDHINEIYDSYKRKMGDNVDYSALAGAELILYNNLNEIRIRNNCEAVNITKPNIGLLRGNMLYKEDLWDVQINPINFVLKNESSWNKDSLTGRSDENKVPVELTTFAIPEDIVDSVEDLDTEILGNRGIVIWDNKVNKEVKIKDKYLKVRVRYSGKDLAIINAIHTLYSISFS